MALDESKDSDQVYEVEGYKYIVDKDFMEKAKPVRVDFSEYGFKLSSNIELNSDCSGCSTTGSGCGQKIELFNFDEVVKNVIDGAINFSKGQYLQGYCPFLLLLTVFTGNDS